MAVKETILTTGRVDYKEKSKYNEKKSYLVEFKRKMIIYETIDELLKVPIIKII